MRKPAIRGAALLAGVALALGASACGGDEPSAETTPEAQALGEERVGSVAQLAQCSDWNEGTREEKLATLGEIKEQINLEDGTGETPEIADDAAYEILENTCKNAYAQSFRLYKLYARATSFASYTEQ